MNKLFNLVGTIVIAAGGAILSLQDTGINANVYGVALASALILTGSAALVAGYYFSLIKPAKV